MLHAITSPTRHNLRVLRVCLSQQLLKPLCRRAVWEIGRYFEIKVSEHRGIWQVTAMEQLTYGRLRGLFQTVQLVSLSASSLVEPVLFSRKWLYLHVQCHSANCAGFGATSSFSVTVHHNLVFIYLYLFCYILRTVDSRLTGTLLILVVEREISNSAWGTNVYTRVFGVFHFNSKTSNFSLAWFTYAENIFESNLKMKRECQYILIPMSRLSTVVTLYITCFNIKNSAFCDRVYLQSTN
jgi:hypothetical protein